LVIIVFANAGVLRHVAENKIGKTAYAFVVESSWLLYIHRLGWAIEKEFSCAVGMLAIYSSRW
jgi:hypothetical protein